MKIVHVSFCVFSNENNKLNTNDYEENTFITRDDFAANGSE